MKKMLIFIVISLIFATGCTKKPVLHPQVYCPQEITNDQINNIIIKAATRRGWHIDKHDTNEVIASIVTRLHDYQVKITHQNKIITIDLVRATGLVNAGGPDEKVESNYNGWVNNLARDIQGYLSKMENGAAMKK